MAVYLVLSILYSIVGAAGTLIFIIQRNEYPINARGWIFTVICVLYGIIHFDVLAIEAYLSQELKQQVSCHLLIWPSLLYIPLWAAVCPFFFFFFFFLFFFFFSFLFFLFFFVLLFCFFCVFCFFVFFVFLFFVFLFLFFVLCFPPKKKKKKKKNFN